MNNIHSTQVYLVYGHSGCFNIMTNFQQVNLLKVLTSYGIQNTHRLTPKYDSWHSFVLLIKNYHVIYVDIGNKPFKITCPYCNVFLRCAGKSVLLLYITFLHASMSTHGLCPEELNPRIFFFKWPGETKIHCIYQSILKEIKWQ